ncbi:MAG TPA: DUF1501 domain-containing protein [Isosphaeraceae bacterium]|jgi:hypothetical protein
MLHHCGRFLAPSPSRREMLRRCAGGFGAVALAALLADRAYGIDLPAPGPPHHRPKARSVIFLFLEGGPSQVDTFDPKPLLDRENGQPFKMKAEPTQFNNNGKTLASPWAFRPGGSCGTPVSDLFPHLRDRMDDVAVIRSMTSAFSEHAAANYFLHTGAGQQGRPSMGSWISYGLGSECLDLPGFVVLNSGKMPIGGPDSFNAGFLPATYQGSVFRAGGEPVAYLTPPDPRPRVQASQFAALRELDRAVAERYAHADALESAVANYEMAFRMQANLPGLLDLTAESPATRRLYGLDAPDSMTRQYAESCLKARRLVERGVRFVEVTMPVYPGDPDSWDAHGNLKANHEANARAVDRPIAALLRDLQGRGLLDSTLVVGAGEFGRTPFAQGADGRDHNPFGFSVWLAGGGIRGGTIYGATDEYGYKAIEGRCQVHDLHATMLHLLGVDHKRLTYRWGGRDMRLTDVHGELIEPILA